MIFFKLSNLTFERYFFFWQRKSLKLWPLPTPRWDCFWCCHHASSCWVRIGYLAMEVVFYRVCFLTPYSPRIAFWCCIWPLKGKRLVSIITSCWRVLSMWNKEYPFCVQLHNLFCFIDFTCWWQNIRLKPWQVFVMVQLLEYFSFPVSYIIKKTYYRGNFDKFKVSWHCM